MWIDKGAISLFMVCVIVGCGDDDTLLDGGGFDAQVVDVASDSIVADSTLLLDATSDGFVPSDSSGFDAFSPDANESCEGTCRDSTECDAEEICVLEGFGTMCVPEAERPSGPGDRCETLDQCADGLACFARNDAGSCGRICCPGEDVCGPGFECVASTLINGISSSWGECIERKRECDVTPEQSTCLPNEGCYIVSSTGMTECLPAGQAGSGESCSEQQDCAPGMFCGGTVDSTCVRICRLDASDCASGEGQCQAYAQSPAGTGLCTQ